MKACSLFLSDPRDSNTIDADKRWCEADDTARRSLPLSAFAWVPDSSLNLASGRCCRRHGAGGFNFKAFEYERIKLNNKVAQGLAGFVDEDSDDDEEEDDETRGMKALQARAQQPHTQDRSKTIFSRCLLLLAPRAE